MALLMIVVGSPELARAALFIAAAVAGWLGLDLLICYACCCIAAYWDDKEGIR